MKKVTKIDWTIKTGEKWWSGTDTKVVCKIFKDDHCLVTAYLEPGNTPRLDKSELATYYWIFQNPTGIGVSLSGTPVPYYIQFPDGIEGHLQVHFTALGENAWEKDWIRSNVHHGDMKHIPGTIDSLKWVENWDTFFFGKDIVLSTDPDEGYVTLILVY